MLINWLWWLLCRAFNIKGPIYTDEIHAETMNISEDEWNDAYR